MPTSLRAREMGVTLTCEVAGGQEGKKVVPLVKGPCLPGLTMETKKSRGNQVTGRCNPLWEE